MKKILFSISLFIAFACSAFAQDGKLKFLAVNDMHSHIEHFPKLAFIVDSIRATCPDLLLVSGGDNRTGNPWNDLAEEPNLPMVQLMNELGFNMSAMGNHECDESQASFANTINKSRFPYLVANMYPDDTLAIHTMPFKLFEHNGLRVAVLGLIELNSQGYPNAHPDKMRGLRFTQPAVEADRYQWLRGQSDVYVLLSHLGYSDEVKLAATHPEFDLIIGGHSHSLIKGEKHNGVFVTQALSYTEYVNEIDVTVEGGKVTKTTCKTIPIKAATGVNAKVKAMVEEYANNPALKRVLTTATNPFELKEELGCMMTDAILTETHVDIVAQNTGGIRMNSMPAGPITVEDILSMDPFHNKVYIYEMTGEQVVKFFEEQRYLYVSGVKYKLEKSGNGYKVTIKNEDGSKFNLKKTYRISTNDYVASVSKMLKAMNYEDTHKTTTDCIISYLEKQPAVDYKGASKMLK